MENKKRFSMFDLLLTVICVVFVAEAAAPVATAGNTQFFWWILLIFTFLLPVGLITAELGTTYTGEGGLYDWVSISCGRRWGARTAWFYWINYPIWMASLAIMAPILLEFVFGISFSPLLTMIIELLFIWICTIASFFPAADNILIFNVSALIKIALALILGGMGIYFGITKGLANPITVESLLPGSVEDVSVICLVLFNFLGFEVVCTFIDSMENPKKQIPQGIIVGGVVIAAVYILTSVGISAGIPVDQIHADSGLIDAFVAMTGKTSGPFIAAMSGLFLITLIGNMISWAGGVNNVVAYASDKGDMPKIYGIRSKKNHMPIGCSWINGIAATIIVTVAPFIPNQDLFWTFFQLNLVAFLASYLPMFEGFLRLRRTDPNAERPYKVPGGDGLLKLIAYLPMAEIILCLILIVVPMGFDKETLAGTLPITIGFIIIVVIDEIYIHVKNIPAKVK